MHMVLDGHGRLVVEKTCRNFPSLVHFTAISGEHIARCQVALDPRDDGPHRVNQADGQDQTQLFDEVCGQLGDTTVEGMMTVR